MTDIQVVCRCLDVAVMIRLHEVFKLFLVHILTSAVILLHHFRCSKGGFCFFRILPETSIIKVEKGKEEKKNEVSADPQCNR